MKPLNVKTVDKWELIQLQKFLNVNNKPFKLILEAYRRKNLLRGDKKHTDKFLGLGFPSEYKSKFFKPSFDETRGSNNWYCLTNSGVELLKVIEEYLPIPKDDDTKTKLNLILYNY